MTETELSREIRSSSLSGVYFFYGDEDYMKNHRIREIKKAMLDGAEDVISFNLFEFTCGEGECPVDEILSALASPPMIHPAKVVVVSFAALDSVKEKDRLALLDVLAEYKDDPACTTIIKASGGGFDYGTEKKPAAFLKSIGKIAKAVRFDYQSAAKLVQWLGKHAASYKIQGAGLTIDPRAAELLISKCGRSMYLLSGEIAKISAYAAERCSKNRGGSAVITVEDVILCASDTDEDDAFRLANAITDGNVDDAYASLGVKMRLHVDPYILLGQISRTVSDLCTASAFLADGREKSEFARECKIHEYKAGLLYKAAGAVPPEYFAHLSELCLSADRAMKTSSSGTKGYGEIEKLIGFAASARARFSEQKD